MNINGSARMVIVLAIVAILSGLVLALTFQWTKPRMDQVAEERLKSAILEVLSKATKYEEIGNDGTLFNGLDEDNNKVGIAFVAQGGGFQGTITMMIGMDVQSRQLTGMAVLSHLETPGLGARIEEDWFKGQFNAKSIDDPFIARQDVDAITGATISSNAVSNILKNTIPNVLEKYESGGGK